MDMNSADVLQWLKSFINDEHIVKVFEESTGSGANLATTAAVPIIKVEGIFNQIIRTIEGAAKNEYQFIKSCQEFFQYEEPHKIELNESGDCGYIIPIKKSIRNFLNKPDVIDLLVKNINETILTTKKNKDLLLKYRDGTAAATNKSLEKNIYSFLLVVYSFGICLSKLLTNPSHRRIYFEAMINDLNELQTQRLTLSTGTGRLHFAFNLLAADNLAANDLGGFQKNFNNGYFCRMCNISYTYKSIPLTDISFLLRSEKSYESYLNQVLQSKNSIFGITRHSDFSNLIAFHPIRSLPFDIMHDFSEGVCMIIVQSILKELSARRILTYAQIEARLEAFEYGQNDQSNKPPTVRPKHLTNNHIPGSASQKLLLFQMLPIIFHDVINRLIDLLPIYTCLREIVSIVFATRIRKSWLLYLTSVPISFHSLMIDKLPDNITAKVHFITHYPELIKRNGPPRNYWCQRFEDKHLYFKKLAIRSTNFKNVSFTLAKRHQLRLGLLLSYEKFYHLIDQTISTKSIKSSQLPINIKLLLVQNHLDSLTYIECQTLIHNHVKYIKNSVFIIALHHGEEIPEFVLLRYILKLTDTWKLIDHHFLHHQNDYYSN
ncbi:unnamed protein product [Rotaria sp. Silwood1]|nr:unnamed protein product [Rotaria sp. Silwood1]